MRKTLSTLIPVLAVLFLLGTGCKKDKDKAEDYDYIAGALRFSVPRYVAPGETLTLTPGGAYHPDGGDIGYSWLVSPTMTDSDTTKREGQAGTGAFVFRSGDDTGSLTITCSAFAKGYYGLTYTRTVTVVKEGADGSLTGLETQPGAPVLSDSRDGRTYPTTVLGGKTWMAANLGCRTTGHAFWDCDVMDGLAGRLYTWTEAQTACPDGWEIPSDSQWADLAEAVTGTRPEAFATFPGIAGALMGNASFNGSRMWDYQPDVPITAASYFNALPAGFAFGPAENRTFDGVGSYAAFWMKDQDGDGNGLYRYLYVDRPELRIGQADKDGFLCSVRCIKK